MEKIDLSEPETFRCVVLWPNELGEIKGIANTVVKTAVWAKFASMYQRGKITQIEKDDDDSSSSDKDVLMNICQ